MTNDESKSFYVGLTRRFGVAALTQQMRYKPRLRNICKDIVTLQMAEDDITSQITDADALSYMNKSGPQTIIQQAKAQQPVVQQQAIDYNLLAKAIVKEQGLSSS